MARLSLVLTLALVATPVAAVAAPPLPVDDAASRRAVGGVMTAAGWAGVALGTGFLIADTRHTPAFSDPSDDVVPPRGPAILAIGATSLVLGLSLALPPDLNRRGIALVPAGPGMVLTGRF